MILSTLASCILSFFLIIQSGTPQWKEYTSPEGKFTVMLPGEPVTGAQPVGGYSPTSITYVTDLKTPATVYHVAYFDTSEMVTETENIKLLLNTTRDRIIERNSLRLQDETEKVWQGYPGRSLRMETTDGKQILSRFYLVRQRVYYLSALSQLAQNESIEADKFFDSFKPMPLDDEAIKKLASKPRYVLKAGVLPGLAYKKVTPKYPEEAKKAGISGPVQVKVLISEKGQVIEAEIIDGPEELREAALNAAKQWTFNPTILDGSPVKVQGILTFNFALR